MVDQQKGWKGKTDHGRDVAVLPYVPNPSHSPSPKLASTARVKDMTFKPVREYEIIRELEAMLEEARQKVAELEEARQ